MAGEIMKGIPFDASEIVTLEGETTYDYLIYAEDMAEWWANFYTNGIMVKQGGYLDMQLKVIQDNRAQVSVQAGAIHVNGRTGKLLTPYTFQVELAPSGQQRIDRVVIELNLDEAINEFRPLLIKGTPSEAPQVPAITRVSDVRRNIYQMSLAQIKVDASGIVEVIDERRDDDLCGLCQVTFAMKPVLPPPIVLPSGTPRYMLGTMEAAKWSNQMYSFEVEYPHDRYIITIEPDQSCTEDQFDAWSAAMMVGSISTNAVKAFGEQPNTDIPIIMEIYDSVEYGGEE